MSYRYAEGTNTSIERSRAEIERLLTRVGHAEAFMYARQGIQSIISFKMLGRIMTIKLLEASPNDKLCRLTPAGRRRADREALLEADRETRRRWRILALTLKAKFAAIQGGVLSIDEEFLPYMQLSNGKTVAEWSHKELLPAIESGKMPKGLLS